jgi:hypothetical protein
MNDKPLEGIVPGLTNPRVLALDRFLIRLRDGSATQSAWRLSVESDEGQGAIILVEISPEETFYRAEGVFLGWPQDRMGSAYRALLPKPEADGFQMQQLG